MAKPRRASANDALLTKVAVSLDEGLRRHRDSGRVIVWDGVKVEALRGK